MADKTKKQKITNRNDWAQFTLGYLHLARLACLEIKGKKYTESIKEGDDEFGTKSIYIPALFNLKHGIEIFLKTFSIEFLNKESIDQSDYSHDIENIFSKLKDNIGEKRLRGAIEKYEKENPKNRELLSAKSIFDKLEDLVKKYQNLDFLKEKIGTDYIIRDTDNTAFKYPANNLSILIDYEKVSTKFHIIDAEKLEIDIVILEKIFWQLYVLLYIERNDKLRTEILKSK